MEEACDESGGEIAAPAVSSAFFRAGDRGRGSGGFGSPAPRNAARSRGTDRIVRRRSAPALNRSPRRWAASPDGFVVRTPAASNAIPINSWRVAPDREKGPPHKSGAAPRRAPQPFSLFGKRCRRFDGCDWCCVCVDSGDLTVSQRPFWGRPAVLPGEEINTGTWRVGECWRSSLGGFAKLRLRAICTTGGTRCAERRSTVPV